MARRKGPQSKQAYIYIKSKILSFELAPGATVSDHALAQELNMSRSPVREAIFMLTGDGLIVSTDTGAQVSPMTLTDIVEICQVRKAVEVAAVNILLDKGGATELQRSRLTDIYKKMQSTTDVLQNYQYDDLFHGEIMEMANNGRLAEISNRMRLQIYRARWLSFMVPARIEEAREEHKNIYQALMDNDRQAIVDSLVLHLDRSENNFKEVLSNPQYDSQLFLAMAHITSIYKQEHQP